MSKKSYTFSYTISPDNSTQCICTHKFRAMNENEAWRRFRLFTKNITVDNAKIVFSDDPDWEARNITKPHMTYGGVPIELIKAGMRDINE